MTTVFVVYSKRLDLSMEEAKSLKHYTFNTNNQLQVGDIIKTANYDSYLFIVGAVLDSRLYFYNTLTGEPAEECTSPNQKQIRFLVEDENFQNKVLYSKVDAIMA